MITTPRRSARSRRHSIAAALVGSLVLLTTACAGPEQESPAGSAGATPSLTIAIGSNAPNFGAVFTALARDLFTKHGVKVTVASANAQDVAPALLTSGKVDLIVTTASTTAIIAQAGQPAQMIYNPANYTGRTVAFISGPNVSSIDELKKKGSNCTIGATVAGSVPFTYAHQVQKAYGLQCKISTRGTIPLLASAVSSGQVDAAPMSVAVAAGVVGKGGHYLLNPATMTDEEASRIVPDVIPAGAIAGLRDNLSKKSDAVVRFLAAVREGSQMMVTETPETLAKGFVTLPYFQGLTAEQLAASLAPIISVFPTGDNIGFVSEEQWNTTLKAFATDWQLPNFDANSSAVQYSQIINMTYLQKTSELQK